MYKPRSCRLCTNRIIGKDDEIIGCEADIAIPSDPDSLDNNCDAFEDIHRDNWFRDGGKRI